MQRVLQKRKDVSKTRSKMKFQACGQVLPFWITGANSHFKLYWPPWWGKGQPIRDLWAAELGPMDANFGLKSRHGLLTYPCLMMRRHCFSCTCTPCLWTYFRQGAVLGAGHTIRPCFASVPNTSLPLVSSLKIWTPHRLPAVHGWWFVTRFFFSFSMGMMAPYLTASLDIFADSTRVI